MQVHQKSKSPRAWQHEGQSTQKDCNQSTRFATSRKPQGLSFEAAFAAALARPITLPTAPAQYQGLCLPISWLLPNKVVA